MRRSGIYQIQSKCKPERIYIGSAVNISRRWNEHINKGKKLPLEHKKHISESLKGRIPWNKGLKNPDGVTGKIKKIA